VQQFLAPAGTSKLGGQFSGEFYLQDDGDICHRSKSVKEFIRQLQHKTLVWLPQLPDLNLIEEVSWTTNFSITVELKAKIIRLLNDARGVQRHPRRCRMCHRNPQERGKVYLFVLREYKHIKPIKQSNNLSMNYE